MKRIIPIIIIIAAIAGVYWWATHSTAADTAEATENELVGSGSIEAETVAITAELGGRVLTLHVAEGDEVSAGDLLIELDQADLLARQIQLEAAVETAYTNLELVSASARPEDVALAEAHLEQSQAARDGAELVWQQAGRLVSSPHELEARINRMKAQVTDAEKRLEMARVNLKRAEIEAEAAGRNQSNNIGLAENETAQLKLQAAQQAVKIAEVALTGTHTQVEHLIQRRDRPLALIAQANAAEAAFHQAEAAVLLAQANLVAAKADPTPEDVNVARAQLEEAEAALNIAQVQLEKQQLTAPRAGLISQKLVNPGELAAPGTMLLELSDIEQVDLIVYIPTTQIGRVQIGQKAEVQVDTYPGEVFAGRVSFIAHEAEFTPRNVQTREERVSLVFAVKIKLDNAEHRLKPGMPADAKILPDMWPADAAASENRVEQDTALARPTPTEVIATVAASPRPTATPIAATATATPTPQAAPQTQAEVLVWALKVRSGPGVDQPMVAHLAQGTVVTVIETDSASGWLRIQLPDSDQRGWISGSSAFVKIN